MKHETVGLFQHHIYTLTSSETADLVVDCLAVRGHCRLLECLGECGVGVTRPANILCARTVLECQHTLCNHLTSIWTDDVDAKNAVSLGIGNEFDHAIRILVALGARICGEGEGTGLVLDARLLDLGLVLADPSDFRVGVHDGRNGAIVDVAVALCEELDSGDSLLLGLVRKHGAECAVTDDSDVWELGAVFLVDDETATLVELEADGLMAEASGVWATADGNKDDIRLKLYVCLSQRSLTLSFASINLQSPPCRPWQPQRSA